MDKTVRGFSKAPWSQIPHALVLKGRVLSTWHLLQLYLCGSESALSSELSSFSSEEIPILPMNSSRWWSSISAISCRRVTNPASNTGTLVSTLRESVVRLVNYTYVLWDGTGPGILWYRHSPALRVTCPQNATYAQAKS